MATIDKNFLNLAGLTLYDEKIKEWSNSASQKGYKTVHIAADGSNLYFYKKADAVLGTDTPDETIPLTSSGADKKVWLTDNTSTEGTNYAKIYKIWQGANAPDAVTDPATLIGTINIPKDMVVSSGIVVDVVFVEGTGGDPDTLHEGSAAGTDVTEEILGTGVTPTAADAGKYIKLTIANADATHLWIKATDLVDIYTGGTTAEVTVNVDSSTNTISATINDIAGTKITYIADAYTQVSGTDTYDSSKTYYILSDGAYVIDNTVDASNFDAKVAEGLYLKTTERESVTAALTRLDGADTVGGSVAKKIKDAIGALDTTNDVAITTYVAGTSGAADTITLTGSIKEEDGVIAAGTADTVVLSNITTTQINALFPSA